jgi:hypothetical protein
MCCASNSLEDIKNIARSFNEAYPDHYVGLYSSSGLLDSQFIAPAIRMEFSGTDALKLFKEYMSLEEWK